MKYLTAFFVLCVAYVQLCDRIIGPDPRRPDDAEAEGVTDDERELVRGTTGS